MIDARVNLARARARMGASVGMSKGKKKEEQKKKKKSAARQGNKKKKKKEAKEMGGERGQRGSTGSIGLGRDATGTTFLLAAWAVVGRLLDGARQQR